MWNSWPATASFTKLKMYNFDSSRHWRKCTEWRVNCSKRLPPHARFDLTAKHNKAKQGWLHSNTPPPKKKKTKGKKKPATQKQGKADLTVTLSKTVNPHNSPHGSVSEICATSQSFAVTLGWQSTSLGRFLDIHGFLGFGGGWDRLDKATSSDRNLLIPIWATTQMQVRQRKDNLPKAWRSIVLALARKLAQTPNISLTEAAS